MKNLKSILGFLVLAITISGMVACSGSNQDSSFSPEKIQNIKNYDPDSSVPPPPPQD